MLALENISLTLGDRQLFNSIDALINPGERVGLVGPNGAGKSTLLKLIAGKIGADAGEVKLSKSATVGYLPQDGVDPDPTLTVLEEVESAFEDLLELEDQTMQEQQKLSRMEAGTDEYQKTLDRMGRLQDQLEQSGAYELEADIEKVLMGLGFSKEDFSRSTTEFSGGWLMRIAMAKLLLQQPTYLLLDEPTNHLDIESLQWIENFLHNYEGAIIIVSHDKAFLNSITERTLALDRGNLYDYSGNYSYYQEKHEERMEHLRKAYQNQQREIKKLQEFIDKFRYNASKASQVQSRIKQLEKMDKIELDEHEEEITFRFPPPERSGAVVMKLQNISKSYGENQVFEGLDYAIERGDKIAVVGPNGAGKSTMVRMLAGLEDFDSGIREPGHNVSTNYFAQHQADELDLDQTVFGIMREAAPKAKETRLRTILGCFLFQGDDVFKKVSVLSGGEKSRLALARMLVNSANFMIFDEPTNHLDMQSKKILQQALDQYEGTFVIVSHDRDFLDPIVSKVLEVQPNRVRTFLGNVSYYLDKKKEEQEALDLASSTGSNGAEISQDSASDSESGPAISRKEERRIEAEKRQRRYKKLKPLKKKIDPLEDKIEKLEDRKEEIETQMAEPDFYDDDERVKEVSLEYEKLKAELVEIYDEWETLALKISKIEEEFE
ncbi:ABC-F family ATP-binding cassette domain-containing protein [Aliifodinibius sp. S!AR15-10]|uniref:ABC-F family ATP-binding cassette domain-containing protein n=1 Tax=Aliifodinibius sp. S!AR15-10 TaxID=2950437 RepID=UPI002858AD84|nr:ABC-F family ATP-binding cassette domain-containing protein [Aliifodinibius sp. S!AR15-10]MDR8392202.1 ABC-F family ATP-binding cassette domain-containing protein [Aliifodinibius sp. S!AR15-10]